MISEVADLNPDTGTQHGLNCPDARRRVPLQGSRATMTVDVNLQQYWLPRRSTPSWRAFGRRPRMARFMAARYHHPWSGGLDRRSGAATVHVAGSS
jgi:hypothetical protein